MINWQKNILNGVQIRFQQLLSYFGRKKWVKIKNPIRLFSEHQNKRKILVVEWHLEEHLDIWFQGWLEWKMRETCFELDE